MDTLRYSASALRWLETVLSERFGHEWSLGRKDECLVLRLAGAEGSIVFDRLSVHFAEANSDLPFSRWDAEAEGWRSMVGGALPAPADEILPKPLIEKRGGVHIVHYDVLGLTYWYLARVEEIGRAELDSHGRFSASLSHAGRHKYLRRPVVDEWLAVLGQVVQRQWPNIELRRHRFRTCLSHDVDRPFQYLFMGPMTAARQISGDLLKRRNARLAAERFRTWRAVRSGQLDLDPFNTFDWLMEQSERSGHRSSFFFICGRTNPELDADYEIENPVMRGLLRRISERGHEIGLHPSYETCTSAQLLAEELGRLKRVCEEEGIHQERWGGRMHYLRWAHPATMRACSEAGLQYDCSLGYADEAGFRCGTAYEYPAFDPVAAAPLQMRLRPLIMADWLAQEIGSSPSGTPESEALNATKRVSGQFSLLWHNSSLVDEPLKAGYRALLRQSGTYTTTQ